jgi:hypothetical protein
MSGVPSLDDFFPTLRWVNRLRGVDVALAHLQSHGNVFVSDLVRGRRRICNAGGSRGMENKNGGAIDELLSLQKTDPEFYTDTVIKGIILVSTFDMPSKNNLRVAMLVSICLYEESAVLRTASGGLAAHCTKPVRSIACKVRFVFSSIVAWADSRTLAEHLGFARSWKVALATQLFC